MRAVSTEPREAWGTRQKKRKIWPKDVLVTFIESIDRFEGRVQINTWLFGVLHHKCQERRRHKARDDLHDSIDAVFESQFDARGNWIRPPVAPDRDVRSREAREAIQECLDALPPLQRGLSTATNRGIAGCRRQ